MCLIIDFLCVINIRKKGGEKELGFSTESTFYIILRNPPTLGYIGFIAVK
jgi:hypothetical protein